MKPLMERIRAGEILIADGAIGSMLLSGGLPKASCPESYNLSHADVLKKIALDYLEAGAEIIQANTFGASPLKLMNYSLEDRTEEINRKAVEAVRGIAEGKAYVSGSCGPSGKILEPYGDTRPEDMYDSFLRQMKILLDSGVDAICIETMTDLKEAVIALRAAKSFHSPVPVMVTMTFDPTPRGFFTIMGTDIRTASEELAREGADLIGSNCGNGIENMIRIAEEFKMVSELPVIIQSNAGLPEVKNGIILYPETPEFMAEKSLELFELDVSVIGGCCGTTPAHIRAIRNAVDALK